MTLHALLLSNSVNPGADPAADYLAHADDALRELLGTVRSALFVPYAAVRFPWAEYEVRVRGAFARLGVHVDALDDGPDAAHRVHDAEAIVVGGGNTFHLLDRMRRTGVLEAIGARVRGGAPYVGWSAGSNVACPTIRTTNDMPIVAPGSLDALGLVPFQINPHFTDQVLPNHRGETREERLLEFVAVNPDVPVVGLREGSMLRVTATRLELLGPHPARLYRGDRAPVELAPGEHPELLR